LIIDSNNNPYLEFRVDSQSVYEILYNDYANELVILNENNEQTLTIQGDKVYVNGLYGNYTRQVMVDTSGLLHVPPFSKTVTFAEVLKEESSPDYKTHYYGYNLPEGLNINKLSIKVGDWNPGVDSLVNSVTVELKRAPVDFVGPAETIFKIQTDTYNQNYLFEEFSTTDLITPFSNIIYNNEYVYFLLIWSCNDCSFRTATLEE
jgi:hypothetical protein